MKESQQRHTGSSILFALLFWPVSISVILLSIGINVLAFHIPTRLRIYSDVQDMVYLYNQRKGDELVRDVYEEEFRNWRKRHGPISPGEFVAAVDAIELSQHNEGLVFLMLDIEDSDDRVLSGAIRRWYYTKPGVSAFYDELRDAIDSKAIETPEWLTDFKYRALKPRAGKNEER